MVLPKNLRPEIFREIDEKLLEKFKVFHQKNPHVFELFRKYATQMRATGRKKYSAWTIVNKIRWDIDIATKGDVFEINNDFIALYVRLLLHHQPQFVGFFELRRMKPTNRRMSGDEIERLRAKEEKL